MKPFDINLMRSELTFRCPYFLYACTAMHVGFSRERSEITELEQTEETKTGRIYCGFGVYLKVDEWLGGKYLGSWSGCHFSHIFLTLFGFGILYAKCPTLGCGRGSAESPILCTVSPHIDLPVAPNQPIPFSSLLRESIDIF